MVCGLLIASTVVSSVFGTVAASAMDDTDDVTVTIESFEGYDCYDRQPFQTIPVDDPENPEVFGLPGALTVGLSDGTQADIKVSWELSDAFTDGMAYVVLLEDGIYELSDTLSEDIRTGVARLPWIQLVRTGAEKISELEPVIMTESEPIIETESITVTEPVAETKTVVETELVTETEPMTESASMPEVETVIESKSVSEKESVTASESMIESETMKDLDHKPNADDGKLYHIEVQTDFRGMALSIDGISQADAHAGDIIHVTVGGAAVGNYYFNGVCAVTAMESYIPLSYDEAADSYIFEMPAMDVLVRPRFGRIQTLDTVGATTHTVTSYTGNSYTYPSGAVLTVGQFVIDGAYDAFCCDHVKNPPQAGTVLTVQEEWSDDSTYTGTLLRRIAYYGYHGGGAGLTMEHFGISEEWLQRYTSLAFSVACGNDDSGAGYGVAFIDWLSTLPNAPKGLTVYRMSIDNDPSESTQDLVYWKYAPNGYLTMHKAVIVHDRHDAGAVFTPTGAEYTVYSDAGCSDAVGVFTIRADGYANEVLELGVGTYYIKESKAPNCNNVALDPSVHEVYVYADNGTHTSSMDSPIVMNVQDYGNTGYLRIHKTVSGGIVSPEGAVYKVYTDEACTNAIAALAIGADGCSDPTEFAVGWYWVKESSAPEGLELDLKAHKVLVSAEDTIDQPVMVDSVDTVSFGYLRLKKGSTNPNISEGNGCYYYSGAVYGVYTDPACANTSKVLDLKTNGQGLSNTAMLDVGTYYVKEITAPLGYALDTTAYTVTILNSHTSTIPLILEVKDTPQNAPINMLLAKYDQDSAYAEGGNTAQGGASLAGAEFTIRYFDGYYSSDNLPATAVRTWTVKTDADGHARLDQSSLVSGDVFYVNQAGAGALPLGTVVIQETKAPEGYLIDPAVYVRQVTSNSTVETVTTYNKPLIAEPVIRGGVKIQKRDSDTGETTAQGNASLAGATFAILSLNDNAVMVEGKAYGAGETVAMITTDAYGIAQTSPKLLPYGSYRIVETWAPTGYLGDGITERSFSITQDGVLVDLTGADNSIYNDVIRGGVRIQKRDSETAGTTAQGDGTLSGATFSIINMSAKAVVIGEKAYESGATVATIKTDAEGIAQTSSDLLPFGTYKIVETGPPTGYLGEGVLERIFTITQNDVLVDLTDAEHSIYNEVIRGGVRIQKRDSETGGTAAQGDGTLARAKFEIINMSVNPVIVDGQSYENGTTVATIITDENGIAQTTADLLPYGTYKVVEVDAPTGYLGQGVIERIFSIRQDGAVIDLTDLDNSIVDDVIRGGVRIQKRDQETGGTLAQGDGTLSGARFDIINISPNAVMVDGNLYENGAVVTTVITNEYGIAQTTADLLPYGTYRIAEIGAPTGYLGQGVTERTFSIRQDGIIVDMTATGDSIFNAVIRGGVRIQKRDYETGGATPLGGATLAGAVFEITNASANAVVIKGTLYEPGEIVATLITDSDGLAQASADLLPYGTYTIIETVPPVGYTGQGVLTQTFSIRNHGDLVDLTAVADSIQNQVIRGDFELTKITSEEQTAMAGVAFKITSMTTGESHTFVTDANGHYSSSSEWNKHSANTNGGGMDDGLWFGQDCDGNRVPVNDTLGALPYDTYLLEELPSEANEGKVLYQGKLVITRDNYVVDMGNIENKDEKTPEIATSARVEDTGTAYAPAEAGVTIIDTVTYADLTRGQAYMLVAELMDAESGEAILHTDGTPVTTTREFKCLAESGTVYVEINFDATGLAGRDVVVFETLYLQAPDGSPSEKVCEHRDMADEGQTIHFPGIKTKALDAQTGIQVSGAADEITLVDTVTYTNLAVGKRYVLEGILYDKETGKAMLDAAGKTISASTVFIAEASQGTVDVTFKFNGADMAGKTIVVFEELYHGTRLYASHTDIHSKPQSIYIPEIQTTATDGETGTHVGYAGEIVTIHDVVDYHNLLPGKMYTVSGTLMLKSTGEPLLVNGETVTVTEVFTAPETDGSVALTFKVPGEVLTGETVVAFETMYVNGIEVAVHADMDSESQSVYYPAIHTTAIAKDSSSHHTAAGAEVTIIDTVEYTSLLPGMTYVLKGLIVDGITGEPLTDTAGRKVVSEIDFVPEGTEGSIEAMFTLDASMFAGANVVVYEDLYLKAETDGGETLALVAQHRDLDDVSQTIHFPEIKTSALDARTHTNLTKAATDIVIKDLVDYENLEVGRKYSLKGTLIDQLTGETVKDALGDSVTAETTVIPEKKNGTAEVVFRFDGSYLAGETLVVFEELSSEGFVYATHTDIQDEAQTIYIPKIQTQALSGETKEHMGIVGEHTTIIDTVFYSNMVSGREYTVRGCVMDPATGEMMSDDTGEPLVCEKSFIADAPEGSIQMEFSLDSRTLAGKSAAVFETIEYAGVAVAVHEDLQDKDQSIYYPDIHTTATDVLTGEHQGHVAEIVTVQDVVEYSQLLTGKTYKLQGILMDQSTGRPYVDADGREVRAEVDFTPEEPDGCVIMEFTFSGANLKNISLVVYETILLDETEVVTHADLNDQGQSVIYPEVELHTTATDKLSGSHQGYAEGTVTIQDVVTYTNLIPGKRYTVSGVLMDQTTGEPYLVDGTQVQAETSFISEEPNGDIVLEFSVDSTGLKAHTLVAFETLSYEDVPIGIHADITDASQTVTYPEIFLGTTAIDALTGQRNGVPRTDTVIEDTVIIKGLEVGQTYTLRGTIMDKLTGAPFLDAKGNEVTEEMTFTAKASEETVTMGFVLDTSDLVGAEFVGAELVVFETLYFDNVQVAGHEDLTSASQTVVYPEVKIGTIATDKDTGTHQATAAKTMTITDVVSYDGLIPGLSYRLCGTLYDKNSGKALLLDGQTVTLETTFTPETEKGEVTMAFTFDGSTLAGHTLVVFETLYFVTDGGTTIEVADHSEINSAEQSVGIVPPKKTITTVKTGDDTNLWPVIVLALVSMAICGAFGGYHVIKKRRGRGNK